ASLANSSGYNDPAGGMLWPYVKDVRSYVCPNTPIAPDSSYAINGVLAGINPLADDFGSSSSTLTREASTFFNLAQGRNADLPFVFIEEFKVRGPDPKSLAVVQSFSTGVGADSSPFSSMSYPGNNHQSGGTRGTTISFADGHAVFWQYASSHTGELARAQR